MPEKETFPPLLDDYTTAPDFPVSTQGRLWPAPYFYPRMYRIVRYASDRSLRGEYGDVPWRHSSWLTVRLMEQMGTRVCVSGVRHFKDLPGPCVFVGNHMSTLETFTLPAFVLPHKRVTFVIKKSLLNFPVFKHVMRARDPIAVTRTDPRADLKVVLTEGQKRLEAGISVIVFPQTTRTRFVQPASFTSIGVKLAARAGVPAIPLALKTDAWDNSGFAKELGPIRPDRDVHFAFGPARMIEGNGRKAHEAILAFIQKQLNQWQEQPPGDSPV